MTNRSVRFMLAVVVLVAIALPVLAQGPPRILIPRTTQKQLLARNIQQVKGPNRLQLLGKQVTLSGYFYDGSVRLLVDNIQRTQCDMMMPPESYIVLSGPAPAGVKSGDRIQIQGLARQPGGQDPAWMQDELIILQTSADSEVSVIGRHARIQLALAREARLVLKYPYVVLPGRLFIRREYAVLIFGGGNAANNHARYWNDLKTMYNILLSHGYTDANIYVLYANGTGRDASVPVDYSASKANITTVFNELAGKMTSNDTLYVMTNDHGGGFLGAAIAGYGPGIYGGFIDTSGDEGDNISEAVYNRDFNGDGDKTDILSVDETLSLWGEKISDDQFAAEVNKITNYSKMTFQMKQCFCGGFLDELTGPNRIVMASSGEVQVSWSYTGGGFGEFTFHFFAALTGNKPDGSGPVNADANGNGKVSMVEAYNYARSHDGRPETPWYEDNNAIPGHTGNMPGGGEGTLGSATYL